MRNIERLMDGVYEAFALAAPNKPFAPSNEDGRITTHCNEAFNLICMRMGYDKFDRRSATRPYGAVLANQMFDMMASNSGDWRALPDAIAAQGAANVGNLVAAIYKNDLGPGHVCTIIPGSLEPSASWGGLAPKVFNVGKDVFLGKKASFAFQKSEMPVYFTLWEAA